MGNLCLFLGALRMMLGLWLGGILLVLLILGLIRIRGYLTFVLLMGGQTLLGLLLILCMPAAEALGLTSRWSSCWWYAVRKQYQEGGIVSLQQSEFGWWWHVKHYQGLVCTEFTLDKKVHRRCPPIIFRGYIKTSRIGPP